MTNDERTSKLKRRQFLTVWDENSIEQLCVKGPRPRASLCASYLDSATPSTLLREYFISDTRLKLCHPHHSRWTSLVVTFFSRSVFLIRMVSVGLLDSDGLCRITSFGLSLSDCLCRIISFRLLHSAYLFRITSFGLFLSDYLIRIISLGLSHSNCLYRILFVGFSLSVTPHFQIFGFHPGLTKGTQITAVRSYLFHAFHKETNQGSKIHYWTFAASVAQNATSCVASTGGL